MDEAGFDHSPFSRNRAWLLEHAIAGEFFPAVVEQAETLKLVSEEHFTVDGTLVELGSLEQQAQKCGTGSAARRSGQSDGELPQ